MRRLLAALAALCLVATAAKANEPTEWNRTGFYVGVVGAWDYADLKADTFKLSDAALSGGPFVGFNARVNPGLVAGIEADYMWTSIKASRTDDAVTVTASNNYLASVRGRVGVPIGPALVYATGGVAMTTHKLSASGDATGSDKSTDFGAVIGGGVEAELTRTLFVRVEALHYWFPDQNMVLDENLLKSGQHQTLIRAGLGFKLN